jgi:hypothetical protein
MSAEVTDGVKTPEGGSETPDLCTLALLVCHIRHGEEGRNAWAAMLEAKAEQSRRVGRFREELHRIIGERDDISFKLNGGCVEAEVEGLRFAALEYPASKKREELTLVTLIGRCLSCGVETASEPFYSLAGLGRMLESFEPTSGHFCPSRQRGKARE